MTGHSTSDVIQGLSVAMNKGLTKVYIKDKNDKNRRIWISPFPFIQQKAKIFKLKKTRELITELLEGHCWG